MARRTKILENIRVASPCTTNWDEMTGDEQARFCRRCDKSVYNLSTMTRQQVAALLADTRGRLCARFSLRPDGTLITLESADTSRASAERVRASRAAAAAFTAALSLCTSVFAQSPPQSDGARSHSFQQEIKPAKKSPAQHGARRTATISGTVYDEQQTVVPRAKVTLINEAKPEEERAVETNDEGVFIVSDLAEGSYTLLARYPGFTEFKRDGIKLHGGQEKRVEAILHVAVMGEIIIVNPPLSENPALNFVLETLSLPYRGVKKIVKAIPR
jgi:hypothetical protein